MASPGIAAPVPPQSRLEGASPTRFGFERAGFPFAFIAELRRRNVVRVAILYLTFCWVILDPVHVIFYMLDVPPKAHKWVVEAMALGFPVVLIFTWLFELTPSGIKPTVLVDPHRSIRAQTGHRMDRIIIIVLTLALIYLVADKFWPALHDAPAVETERVAAAARVAQPTSAPATPVVPAVAPAAATAPATLPAASPAAAMAPATAPAPSPPMATAPATVAAAAAANATGPAASVALPLRPEAQGPGSGPEAVATIVGGPVLFIRGASRFAAAPGVRLGGGDLVATGADAELQLEFEGGTRLDLGPLTSLMLLPEEAGSPPRHVVYLQSGWLKLTAGAPSARAIDALRTARFELAVGDNVTVTRLDGEEVFVFAELGSTRILERRRGSSATEVALRSGQLYSRRAQLPGSVLAHSSPQFVKQLPPQFLETLPSRLDAFRGRAVAARPASDFTYAEVEPWLKADAPIRRQLVERWKDKAHEPAFRRALEANLRELPDWQPILYPPPPPDAPDSHAPNAPAVGNSPPS